MKKKTVRRRILRGKKLGWSLRKEIRGRVGKRVPDARNEIFQAENDVAFETKIVLGLHVTTILSLSELILSLRQWGVTVEHRYQRPQN